VTGQPRRVRRPRYVPFIATGVVIGLVATALVVVFLGGEVDDRRKLAAYLAIMFAGFGALAGGGLAVWLERGERDAP
jgi:H+/Cl- antiporter ClcA